MGLNAVGSAPSLVQNSFHFLSAKNRTRGKRGEGANRTFAQLPQSAGRMSHIKGQQAAQPAEPNAVMEAWMTVFNTGDSPKEVNVSPTTASIIA